MAQLIRRSPQARVPHSLALCAIEETFNPSPHTNARSGHDARFHDRIRAPPAKTRFQNMLPPRSFLSSICELKRAVTDRSTKEIMKELSRLMLEQVESLKHETFMGISPDELRRQEGRLKRIRELSADYLAALQRNDP